MTYWTTQKILQNLSNITNVMKQQRERLKNELSKLSNKGNLLRSLQEDKHKLKLIKQINSLNLEINVQLSADTASVAIQEWQTSKKGRTVDA